MKNPLLQINELELGVFLGLPNEERARRQVVKLNIEVAFPDVPDACKTDDINDTVCYHELINSLRSELEEKTFHLIEHLTQEVYNTLAKLLPENSTIAVSLTKHPQIQGLGSVTFHYGE